MSTALAQPITPFTVNSAATTNTQVIKAGPVRLFSLVISNVNAAARFVKIYDKATAPVLATDVPIMTIPVPANDLRSPHCGVLGHQFANGIAIAITGLGPDTDATAVAAGDVKVAGGYA